MEWEIMGYGREAAKVEDMQGKLLLSLTGMEPGSEEIRFTFADGSVYTLSHYQDCCEYVRVVDVTGEASVLVGQVLTLARVDESPEYDNTSDNDQYYDESGTWTFYTFGSVKGTVQVRWLGQSNGYYSESVDFDCVKRATTLTIDRRGRVLPRDAL